MTLMWVVAGLILGLGLFLMIRHKFKAADNAVKLHGKMLTCHSCGKAFDEGATWVRSGFRGEEFKCPFCGSKTWVK